MIPSDIPKACNRSILSTSSNTNIRTAVHPIEANNIPATGITLQFAVEDSGIGMSSLQLDGIFEAFAQAGMSTTRQYGGTGLGLAFSERLVRLMCGSISVASEPARGSRSTFSIRAQHPSSLSSSPVR